MRTLPVALPLAILLAATTFAGCDPCACEPPAPEAASVAIQFRHLAGGTPLAKLASPLYTDPAGNAFNVSALKYYFTNVVLTREDGSTFAPESYHLVDAFDPETHTFTLAGVPNGVYTRLDALIGVDSLRNHSGPQTGALDPAKGMIWTWASGYIFALLEGAYQPQPGAPTEAYRYHVGTDANLMRLSMPLPNVRVEGQTRTLYVDADVFGWFNGATPWGIRFNDDLQSLPGEGKKIALLVENIPYMLTLNRVE